jgi:hypothetical protein
MLGYRAWEVCKGWKIKKPGKILAFLDNFLK